ncbi:MAG: Sec-independent protein translocase protein TatB [Pseudomonadota bacterium]
MFDLSFWEIAVIAIVAVIIVGPERLPSLAYKAGQWVTKIRRFVSNAKAEMESEFNTAELRKLLNAQEEEMQKLRKLVEDTRHDVEQSQNLLTQTVEDTVHSVQDAAAQKPVPSKPAPSASSTPASAPLAPRSIEDEMQSLSQELGETLHRPNFGGESDLHPSQSTPTGTKQA